MKIKYTKLVDTYVTEEFGNMLSDTYQGQVTPSNYENPSKGTWSGWVMNLSDSSKSIFILGLSSKAKATRWVNLRIRRLFGKG